MGAFDFVPDVETPEPEPAPGHKPQPHVQVQSCPERPELPPRRLTHRPTFLENLASSRDTQFTLKRHSSDVDRYFVCCSCYLVSEVTE